MMTGEEDDCSSRFLKKHLFENLLKHPEFMTNTKLAISETYQQADMIFVWILKEILTEMMVLLLPQQCLLVTISMLPMLKI